MSIIKPVTTCLSLKKVLVTWSDIATGDTVVPFEQAFEFSRMTVDVQGTFANGTAVVLNGTVDGTHWHNLRELYTGLAISLLAVPSTFLVIQDVVRQFVPGVSSGHADSITVSVLFQA